PDPQLPGVLAVGGETPDRTRHNHRTGVECPSGTPFRVEGVCLRAVYTAHLSPQRSSAFFKDLSRCYTSTFTSNSRCYTTARSASLAAPRSSSGLPLPASRLRPSASAYSTSASSQR